jgi:hypothetical protein
VGTSPRDVHLRTLQRSPFAGVARCGNAEEAISALHNAEKMHQHYSDSAAMFSQASNQKARETMSGGSDGTAPRLKWTVDPGMTMW